MYVVGLSPSRAAWQNIVDEVDQSYGHGYSTVSVPSTSITSPDDGGPMASTSGGSRSLEGGLYDMMPMPSDSLLFSDPFDSGVSDESHHGLYDSEFLNLIPPEVLCDDQGLDLSLNTRLTSSPESDD